MSKVATIGLAGLTFLDKALTVWLGIQSPEARIAKLREEKRKVYDKLQDAMQKAAAYPKDTAFSKSWADLDTKLRRLQQRISTLERSASRLP